MTDSWNDLCRAARVGRISRRRFMSEALAIGVPAALAASTLASAGYADEPQRGGALKIGIAGGSSTDSLDPRTWADSMPFNVGFAVMNQLIEIDPDNNPIPSLFESWTVSADAATWVFKVRGEVTFHNGKSLDAEDVIYSINLHRGGKSISGATAGLKPITALKATGRNEVTVTLAEGDIDFHYALSDYHLVVVPKGFTDWAHPIGTGAFTFESFVPGESASLKRYPGHWNPNRGYVDEVAFKCLNDTPARMNALTSGEVDIIHRVDTSTIDVLKHVRGLQLVIAHGGYHPIYVARCDAPPFNDPNLRLALKFAIDREQLLKSLFNGHGAIGNDSPIPPYDRYYNKDMPQTGYDPDKASFYFKQAKIDGPMVLFASDAAFNGALDAARLFQANAKAAGIAFDVKPEPVDGYYRDVWLKVPFCESYWAGRASATEMFTTAYKSDAAWNETGWKVPAFDALLAAAKREADPDKRGAMIFDLQEMVHDDGGAIIPAFKDWVDATATRVKGYLPHHLFDLCNGRAAEKVWLDA
jgi:peptide/nickel transport system substrate-binding protein